MAVYIVQRGDTLSGIAQKLGISSTSGTFTADRLKLEKGNMVTDWTPAPEDTDTSISETAARNDTMAQKLGYADYNALVGSAALKTTLIDGGYLNTDLINANDIITKGL